MHEHTRTYAATRESSRVTTGRDKKGRNQSEGERTGWMATRHEKEGTTILFDCYHISPPISKDALPMFQEQHKARRSLIKGWRFNLDGLTAAKGSSGSACDRQHCPTTAFSTKWRACEVNVVPHNPSIPLKRVMCVPTVDDPFVRNQVSNADAARWSPVGYERLFYRRLGSYRLGDFLLAGRR